MLSGATIAYQGYAGKNVLNAIKFNGGGRDPKDNIHYTYTIDKKQKQAQLMGYFEEYDTTKFSSDITSSSTYTASYGNYVDRKIGTIGKKIGILVESGSLAPIQSTSSGNLDIASTSTGYVVYFNSTTTGNGTGSILQTTFVYNSIIYNPEGTIPSLCGTSNGTIVSTSSFSGSLCTAGSTIGTWSGNGGTTTENTLSWTCKDITNTTSNCSANYNKFSSLGATCDVYDILIGSLTGTYQVWGGCNVGASSTTDWNTGALVRTQARDGYLFQFGRDDPFPVYGAVATGSTQSTIGTGVFTTAVDVVSTGTFIVNADAHTDWRSTPISTLDDTNLNVWQTPTLCPVGYHIPVSSEFQSAFDNGFDDPMYDTVNNLPSALRMPLSGGRGHNDGVLLNSGGPEGYYWSSSPNPTFGYYFYFNDSGGTLSGLGDSRSYGFSVRCIKN